MDIVNIELLEQCNPRVCRAAARDIRAYSFNLTLPLAYAECLEYIAILKERNRDLVDNMGKRSGGGKTDYENKGRENRGKRNK